MQPFFASFTNSIRCPHFATVRARASSQSQPLASPDVRPLIHSGDGYACILCAPDSRAFIFLSFSEKKKRIQFISLLILGVAFKHYDVRGTGFVEKEEVSLLSFTAFLSRTWATQVGSMIGDKWTVLRPARGK